jgi:DNA replication protein DnaC
MDKAKSAPFAVLDDIGVRAVTDGFRGDLHEVINHRVANKLPTIYTSNIPIDQLDGIFGERRLSDRIRHMTKEIHFEGTSKRGMRK